MDFRKFENFRRFFRHNSAKNCRSELWKDGKDAAQRDLDLGRLKVVSPNFLKQENVCYRNTLIFTENFQNLSNFANYIIHSYLNDI